MKVNVLNKMLAGFAKLKSAKSTSFFFKKKSIFLEFCKNQLHKHSCLRVRNVRPRTLRENELNNFDCFFQLNISVDETQAMFNSIEIKQRLSGVETNSKV